MEWQKIRAIIGDRYLQHSYLTSDILMTAALRFSVLPTVCEGHKCINEKCTNLLWKSQLKLGVESDWNSFEIRLIQLIRKGKKYSKNSMKIDSKLVRFDSNYRVESNFSDAGFVRNSFDSIRKFMIRLIRKVKNNSKNLIKINFKFVRFDSTPPLVQILYGSFQLWYIVVGWLFRILLDFFLDLKEKR